MPRGGLTDATRTSLSRSPRRRPASPDLGAADVALERRAAARGAPARHPTRSPRAAATSASSASPSSASVRGASDSVRLRSPRSATARTPDLGRLAEQLLRERERRHPLATRRRARSCARCFSAAFAAFQCTSTSSGVFATASPKTCGCRRTIFSVSPRATSSMSNGSSGSREAISAWNSTCQSRSPSSSRSSAREPSSTASISSALSSTRYGTSARWSICCVHTQRSRTARIVSAAARGADRSRVMRAPPSCADAASPLPVVARTPRHEACAARISEIDRTGEHAEDRLVAHDRVAARRRARPAAATP